MSLAAVSTQVPFKPLGWLTKQEMLLCPRVSQACFIASSFTLSLKIVLQVARSIEKIAYSTLRMMQLKFKMLNSVEDESLAFIM